MTRRTVDFSSAPSYGDLPRGVYEGTIGEMKIKPATQEGKFDQLSVRLEVDDDDDEHGGERAWQNLSFSPNSAGFMKQFFDLFGMGDDVEADGIDDDDDTHLVTDPDLVGEPVKFKVEHETYKGEKRVRATVIEWLGKAPSKSEKPKRKDEDDDEKPARSSTKRKAVEDDDDDEDEKPARKPARTEEREKPARRALR